MTQKPYYRDIWALFPSGNGYPGAFPKGLIDRIKKRWWGKKRLHLFSGSYRDSGGTMIDVNPDLKPTHALNCEELPFDDESFDFVMADPPYSEEEAMALYNMPYPSMVKVLNEMARVCKPGGHALLLHRIIPRTHPLFNSHFKRLKIIGVVGVFIVAGMTNIRALTVWRKLESLNLDSLKSEESRESSSNIGVTLR